jgi:hypothetical protein
MLGVNRSSHLSAVGDTNPVNQALYLAPVPYFVFAHDSWHTVMDELSQPSGLENDFGGSA